MPRPDTSRRRHPSNAVDLVRDADVVLDCTDNVATRYLLSDACAILGVPLVSAAAVSLEGQLSVFCRARCAWLRDAASSRRSAPHPPCYTHKLRVSHTSRRGRLASSERGAACWASVPGARERWQPEATAMTWTGRRLRRSASPTTPRPRRARSPPCVFAREKSKLRRLWRRPEGDGGDVGRVRLRASSPGRRAASRPVNALAPSGSTG